MSDFVLDNSVTMRWCFESNIHPYADGILQNLETGDKAFVPVLWLYEVSSVLSRAERNGTLTSQEASEFIKEIKSLDITIDHDSTEKVLTEVYRLAITHGLTAYDAAYLELAIRKNLPLATLDAELIAACTTIGHPVL